MKMEEEFVYQDLFLQAISMELLPFFSHCWYGK